MMTGNSISKDMIKSCLQDFEKILNDKVENVSARINDAKFSGSEFYACDMQGYQRGLIEMGNWALNFFNDKLLGSK
jgi:hypothetical protein